MTATVVIHSPSERTVLLRMDAMPVVTDGDVWLVQPEKDRCEWTQNEDGWWDTGCKRAFDIQDSGSLENSEFLFCPYCGAPIMAKPYSETQEDE